MKELQNYTTALRDVGLDSTPIRKESGEYCWSNGQLEILNQPEFKELSVNRLKIVQTDESIQGLTDEILAFEAPTEALEHEGKGVLGVNQDDIDDQYNQLDQFKNALVQLDKDLMLRGYFPPESSRKVEEQIEAPLKKPKVSGKEVLGFLLTWIIGEVFMTYVQWNGLRDGRGIEDMIVRSISLGVVLFLIHLVGRYYKKEGRPIHMIFLGFSFLMLFTMLVGPLLLNEAYPPLDSNQDTATQWSLQEDTAITEPVEVDSPYPFWVNFYRKNDMLPGIFVFLFFVIMQTFAKKKNMAKRPVVQLPLEEPDENNIEDRRQYYQQQIDIIEKRLKNLHATQLNAITPNTQRLNGILDELQAKQAKVMALKKDKDHLVMENDLLLRRLTMHLNQYQTEYTSVLKNDQVKALVVQPSWPSKQDLKDYYNLP